MSPMLRPLWRPPPADLTLSNAEVHLWRASLDQPPWRVRQLDVGAAYHVRSLVVTDTFGERLLIERYSTVDWRRLGAKPPMASVLSDGESTP